MESGYPGMAPASEARLVGVLGPYTGQTFRIRSGEAVIGRDPGLHVSLTDEPTVSRRHAVLMQRGAGWVLRDEGSANGTWVNGVRIEEQTLLPEDTVRFGQSEFRFEMDSATMAAEPADQPQPGVPESAVPAPPPSFGQPGAALGNPAVFGGGAGPGAPLTPGAAPPPGTLPAPGTPPPFGQPGAPQAPAPLSGTYTGPVGPGSYTPAPYSENASPTSIVVMIMGILSVTCGWCFYIGFILSPATIALGIYEWTAINAGRSSKKGMVFNFVGIGLASFSLLVGILILILAILAGSHR